MNLARVARPDVRLIFAFMVLVAGALPVHAIDTYEGSGVVQVPALSIGSSTLTNVVLTANLSLVRAPNGAVPIGTEDIYDPATNQLVVPAVKVGANTFFNVIVTVEQLMSVASVSGADTFDGTNLVIPNVQVGGQVLHDVTLHVSLSNVAAVHGGMPSVSFDQYNGSTGQLAIGAVQVGAKVYTNVLLNVGSSNVVSVGGFKEQEVHGFLGSSDGADPVAGLLMDASGNLYGTTGGISNVTGGTVFKLAPNGSGGYTETVLYDFTNGSDGGYPLGGVILDAGGNLYGTTASGGSAFAGTVFKLTPGGDAYTESVLYSFAGGTSDGSYPNASLVMDASGNLYGTTRFGGSASMGTVFKLTLNGGSYSEAVIYNFQGGNDGNDPLAALIFGPSGNLLGTTSVGGSGLAGTVFSLNPDGAGGYTKAILYNFTGGNDGGTIQSGVILDASGNLFGTASYGGTVSGGTAYKLTPNGSGGYTQSVLHNFGAALEDGEHPLGGLILDGGGILYGTASTGGVDGRGTVFKLTPSGTGTYNETILYNFPGSPDGNEPVASLLMDASGNLFGTTASGGPSEQGSSYGMVFEIQ